MDPDHVLALYASYIAASKERQEQRARGSLLSFNLHNSFVVRSCLTEPTVVYSDEHPTTDNSASDWQLNQNVPTL